MKSLHIGVFDTSLIHQASPYCGDNVFAKGFEMNGFNVTRFDYRASDNCNSELISVAKTIQPDVLFFGKCERINAETIANLRELFPNAQYIKWGADVRMAPTDFDLAHNQHMDWFFATYGGDYLKLHLLPSMKGVCSLLTFTDSEFYNNKKIDFGFRYDVLWTGRPGFGDNKMRNEIIEKLLHLNGKHRIGLFGNGNWLGNPEYLYAINGSKIGVGSNSFNRDKYSSDRLGNYMSCGTFYLTQKIPGLDQCFVDGEHLDSFSTMDEMESKIEFYLKNDELREKIAKNGQALVHKYFDCKPLVSNILYTINNNKSSYVWDDCYSNL